MLEQPQRKGQKAKPKQPTKTAAARPTQPAPLKVGRTPAAPRKGVKAAPMIGPQLPPGARKTTPRTLPTPNLKVTGRPATPPREAGGIMGFFRKQLTGLHASATKNLPGLLEGAKKVVRGAADFAKNPVKGVANGVAAAGKFAGAKVEQFRKWYATPEGKAKFWKGVAVTAVAVATVATGGALTAPALALAAGISAGGGIAAQVVENKVFNAAAKARAQKDKKYTFKERTTFEGVTARSIAVDAIVGSVGGPVFKFAGKAVVGVGRAFGKGLTPAARGLGHLAQGALKGSGKAAATLARRVLPAGAKTVLKNAGRLAQKYLTQPVGRAATSVKNAVTTGISNAATRAGHAARKVRVMTTRRARQARAYLKAQTPTLRKLASRGADAITGTVRKSAANLRRWDNTALSYLRNHVRQSPVLKAARKLRDAVDGAGNTLSRRLTNARVKAADHVDAWKATLGGKISQTSVARHARHLRESTVQRLDDLIARNPDGHVAKAIVEFRASGAAIRTHLNKVWTDASHDLNKDLSRLLGRHGSVQADFKVLAEQGAPLTYQAEVAHARALAEKRLGDKVAQDTEAALLAQPSAPGVTVSPVVIRQRAQAAAEDAVKKSADLLTRQAETFVARHPSTTLQTLAMKTEALNASKKAMERYFGKNAADKGAFERLGMALTTPARVPINERLEKYGKVVQALRSTTPLASMVTVGSDAVDEVLSKAAESAIAAPVKAKAKELKGEKDEKSKKKATEEEASGLLKVAEDVMKEVFPSLNLDEILDDTAKQLNMKAGD
ncbi:hypothetical protein [Deinococcus soli (ex Cha et al. 2016)]|uniref:Uncharacterized protein n=2 Tax=Deinococcus soli (ex Cha et al. 2016) TaxID=1309411 RepID=A0AAE4BNW4_9DEIO|nr:hypothetical protein [Deinococcus soli (ex Cha et al. 2016)]MDR6220385.1 hypothetical protein [Deinococcus soli (ex Cha et al. 2016)]MDR6330284.1 hypothetical protein [Deinococcus soli (ex Cha et al. 2016)]MDR6753836.1 hypothetical protein [Deinococcus soli (ex Cha et al. 2016)]